MTRDDNKQLRPALWAAQLVVVASFELTGVTKACVSPGAHGNVGPWAAAPAPLLPTVGAVESLGAVLLLLPSTLRVLPALAPASAAALSAVALLGAAVPASGAGALTLLQNLALAALAGFVAWGRTKAAPVEAFEFEGARDTSCVRADRLTARVPPGWQTAKPRPQRPVGPLATA